MMAQKPQITPPTTLDGALGLLLNFSNTEFDELSRVTSQPQSFMLNAKALKDLQARVPAVSNNLPVLLGALSFLYQRVSTLREAGESAEALENKLLDELDFDLSADQKETLKHRLSILLRPNKDHIHYRKLQRLQSGFLPNAISFRTLVDLRPDFGEDDAVDYQGLLKVIQFRVLTDSHDPTFKELVFQLNEETLDELSEVIARAKRKLAALDNEGRLREQLIEIK